MMQVQDLTVPSDMYVIPDDAADPPSLIVVDKTLKLHLLFIWINNNGLVEGTSDGRSQIVAINEQVAFEKKISYDPTK